MLDILGSYIGSYLGDEAPDPITEPQPPIITSIVPITSTTATVNFTVPELP